jgi:hypothetical protein
MRLFIAVGTAILLSSCASSINYYPQTVQSWNNGSVSELVKRWGAPDETFISASGNKVLMYNMSGINAFRRASKPGVGVNYSGKGKPVIVTENNNDMVTDRTVLTLPCVVTFRANQAGTIISANSQGSGCYANANFATRMGNR